MDGKKEEIFSSKWNYLCIKDNVQISDLYKIILYFYGDTFF